VLEGDLIVDLSIISLVSDLVEFGTKLLPCKLIPASSGQKVYRAGSTFMYCFCFWLFPHPISHPHKWQNILPASEDPENILHSALVLRPPDDAGVRDSGDSE